MIDFVLLQHFIAVARTRSFTRAASDVHASRPAITRSIKRLEDQVGTRLFERTTRSVTLTPAGEELYADALFLADRASVASEKARRIGQGKSARLRIGICPSAQPETPRIAHGVRAFRRDWPDLDLQVQVMPRNLQGDALRTSEIDVSLMMLNRSDCSGLEWRVIRRGHVLVWLPASWGFRQPRIKLEELRDRPWLMASPRFAPDINDLQMALCRSAGFEPKVAAYIEDPLTGSLIAACDLGAAFMHDWDAPDRAEGDISVKRIEGVSEYFWSEMVVAWAAGARSAQIEAFVRQIVGDQPQAFGA